ncbi:hypothetical protein [Nocardioides deserti]|uniref:Uncharacterized protein n=1 Tax=Nocardioides deserti TaxID=1588644 RepID=A0ABR6UB05_9ACTN|nr:hypothetical protein [Nocardioides deserti]MBC2961308.1 hypothetical protein [Nocardioides deserti]GGO72365.1 hypothetical protein GCM10012276_15530 [Nocardioides deserti]
MNASPSSTTRASTAAPGSGAGPPYRSLTSPSISTVSVEESVALLRSGSAHVPSQVCGRPGGGPVRHSASAGTRTVTTRSSVHADAVPCMKNHTGAPSTTSETATTSDQRRARTRRGCSGGRRVTPAWWQA